jgi:hypothetical protein
MTETNTRKCPVCDWAITDSGIKVQAAGKEITVCCDDCAGEVRKEPGKYVSGVQHIESIEV